MVVINEILNFEPQMEKYKPEVWGDLPVIDNSKLSNEEKESHRRSKTRCCDSCTR